MPERVIAGVALMLARVVANPVTIIAAILMMAVMTMGTAMIIAKVPLASLKRVKVKVTNAVVIVDMNIVNMNIMDIVKVGIVNMNIINIVKVIIVDIVNIIIKSHMSIGRLKVIKATLILVNISSVQ